MQIDCEIARCGTCVHWNGTSRSQWGDCQYIIGELQPDLFVCQMDRGDGYYFFTVPFDPHDIKYYTQSLTFKNLYGQLKNKRLPEGVRLDKKHERVIMYTKDGGESRRVMQLLYFQTNKEYRCDNYAAH